MMLNVIENSRNVNELYSNLQILSMNVFDQPLNETERTTKF